MRHPIRHLLVLAILFGLLGCKQAIYTNLTESEANDVLLSLVRGGIPAEKRVVDGNKFSVFVPDADIATAIELLRADAQPSEHYANLGEVFARNGLISSPTEERVRFIYGLQQELAKTLSQIDGVLLARVHIVVPANDPFGEDVKPASASVFLKYRSDMNMQLLIPAVKDLIVRSVEGLKPENVAVSLFPARATLTTPVTVPITRFFGANVAAASVTKLWIVFAVPWVLVAALVVMLLHATRLRELIAAALRTRRSPDSADASDGIPMQSERSTREIARSDSTAMDFTSRSRRIA